MFLSYSIHYPKPEKEALLIDAMRRGSLVIKSLPGNLFDNVFKDVAADTLMAVSIWESQEALQAAMPPFREALKDIPYDSYPCYDTR